MIFLGYDISGIISFLKVLGFILSIAFTVGIILIILGEKKLSQKKQERRQNYFIVNNPHHVVSKEMERWQNIKAHFQSKNPNDWRIAIIDADAMLEDLIDSMGYQGVSLGDKLKSIHPQDFPFLNDAWYVHKLRNNLAHQGSTYHLSEREAFQAHKIYENIFYGMRYITS